MLSAAETWVRKGKGWDKSGWGRERLGQIAERWSIGKLQKYFLSRGMICSELSFRKSA